MLARDLQRPILKIIFLIFIFQSFINSKSLITSSQQPDKTSSFTFSVSSLGYYVSDGFLYVGAAQTVPNNNFSISVTRRGAFTFSGITPEKTILNNIPDQSNPLHGAKIKLLSLLCDMPAVVKDGDDKKLYFCRGLDTSSNIVVQSSNINDSNGAQTGGIIGIATNQPGTVKDVNVSNQLFFSIVKPNSGNFGDDGSGLAMLQLIQTFTSNNGIKNFNFNIFDSNTGTNNGNKAIAINTSTQEIKLTDNLVSLTNQEVDMFWDTDFQKLYIALQGQGGSGSLDGLRGVLVAYVQTTTSGPTLQLQRIIPDSALNIATNNNIIAGVGANSQVSIFKVRTTKTSTGLKYMVVVGANGDSGSTKNQVYALPLVNVLNTTYGTTQVGTIASKLQSPIDVISSASTKRVVSRGLTVPATTNAQLPTNTDSAALVGQGPMYADIQDINVIGDTVYVSIADNGNNQQSGIFYSQAIFNANGTISTWTPWARTAGNAEHVFGFVHDYLASNFLYIQSSDNSLANADSVYTTTWSTGSTDFETLINSEISPSNGGIQGIFKFGPQTPSFDQSIGLRTSLTLMTGYNKVIILQDGKDNNGSNFGYNPDFGTINYRSTDGSLIGFSTCPGGLSITGGALNDLKAIVSATVATNNSSGWIFVGGNGGLAVLCDENGNGWAYSPGLSKDFQDLSSTLRFKKIGDFTNIRKLVACNSKLYILTDRALYRVDLAASLFAEGGTFSCIKLANLDVLPGGGKNQYLTDFVAKNYLAVLTTSSGIFYTGPQSNIRTAQSELNLNWQYLNLNESVGSFTRIFDLNFLETDTGFANLYVLNSYVGFNQTRVYRIAIDLSNGSIPIVTPFNDLFVAGIPTYFINIGAYRNNIYCDGTNLFLSRSRYVTSSPFLELVTLNTVFSNPFARNDFRRLLLNIDPAKSTGKLVRTSGSGSFILAGDFGIRINS